MSTTPSQKTNPKIKQKTKIKRGGQPANTNALKHGIYSRHFTSAELISLDQDVSGSLKDEMDMLRVTIADAARSVLVQPESDMPFTDHISALHTISIAVARLVNVIHTRLVVFGDPDQRAQQVDALLALMVESKKIKELEQMEKAEESVTPAPPSSKKLSGAQPANTNALKHGFYSHAFTPSEKKFLQDDGSDGLRDEESLLRVLILRAWHSMRSFSPADLTYQEYLFALRANVYAIFVIEKIQRARRCLFGEKTELERDIHIGLGLACKDLGIQDYLNTGKKK